MKPGGVVGDILFFQYSPVETPVAFAGGALEAIRSTIFPTRHKLATAIEDMATGLHGVVLQALTVSNRSGGWGSGGGIWIERRRRRRICSGSSEGILKRKVMVR